MRLSTGLKEPSKTAFRACIWNVLIGLKRGDGGGGEGSGRRVRRGARHTLAKCTSDCAYKLSILRTSVGVNSERRIACKTWTCVFHDSQRSPVGSFTCGSKIVMLPRARRGVG